MTPIVHDWLAEQGMAVATEFRTEQGVPDLVACDWEIDKLARRNDWPKQPRLTSPLDASLWLALPTMAAKRARRIDDLLRQFEGICGESKLREVLARLEHQGLARQNRSGGFSRLASWYPMHRRVIAIELKLQRTTEALRQATRYRAFADESYVAMPEGAAASAARRCQEFLDAGVGLLSVLASKRIITLLPAPPRSKDRSLEMWQMLAVERLFRRSTSN